VKLYDFTWSIGFERFLPEEYHFTFTKSGQSLVCGPGMDLTNLNLSLMHFHDKNLSGAFLNNTKVRASDLVNVNLEHAVLTNTDFSFSQLLGTRLAGADLTGARLVNLIGLPKTLPAKYTTCAMNDNTYSIVGPGVNLSGMDLQDISLDGVDLSHSNLSGCDLSGADLKNTDLSNADLYQAKLVNLVNPPLNLPADCRVVKSQAGAYNIVCPNLVYLPELEEPLCGAGMMLDQLDFSFNDLHGARLSTDNMLEDSLSEINLNTKDLRNTYLHNRDLSTLDLTEANFEDAYLADLNFRTLDLCGAKFNSAQLMRADFAAAILDNADFSQANLTNANFSWTDLSRTTLDNAILVDLVGHTPFAIPKGYQIARAASGKHYCYDIIPVNS
jgi:uncharacterized protein YjbI with pentapeptide repeats